MTYYIIMCCMYNKTCTTTTADNSCHKINNIVCTTQLVMWYVYSQIY